MRHAVVLLVLAFVAAACGASANPTASPSASAPPVATPSPMPSATASAVAASGDPFANRPYTLTVPVGWQTFDLSNPSAKTGFDAFAQANPAFSTALQAFESSPNVWLAVNSLLGGAVVVLPLSSQGLPLETIGQSLTAQFATIAGVASPGPVAEPTTLPGGDAIHWEVSLNVNKTGGGTYTVVESLYLFANAQTAAIVEFVNPSGGVLPDESSIIDSFEFR